MIISIFLYNITFYLILYKYFVYLGVAIASYFFITLVFVKRACLKHIIYFYKIFPELKHTMPLFTTLLVFFTMVNIALPYKFFLEELLFILDSVTKINTVALLFWATCIILGGSFFLGFFNRNPFKNFLKCNAHLVVKIFPKTAFFFFMLFWKMIRDFKETSPVLASFYFFLGAPFIWLNDIFVNNGLTPFSIFFLYFHVLPFYLIDFFDNEVTKQRFTSFLGPGVNVEKLVLFYLGK